MAGIATHEILKPFEADGVLLQSGQHVDASGWRNTRQLVNTRYMAPLIPGVITTEVIPKPPAVVETEKKEAVHGKQRGN